MNRQAYYKDIDGKRLWYNGVIITDTEQIFTWEESEILAHGWTKYVAPEPTLEEVKSVKCVEIDDYDQSPAINSFFIGNQVLWLDKDTRTGLSLRFKSEQEAGRETTTLWYGTTSFTLSVETAVAMLGALELYASACYDNTQQHKANVMALESKEAVEAYDYESGYPDKLTFDNI